MNQTKTLSRREEVLRKAIALLASLALAFSLVPAMTFTAWADDEPSVTEIDLSSGEFTITEGGEYQLAEGVSGVVKVNTTEAVTIVGNGATWNEGYVMTSTPNSSLYFDCTNQAGVNLTLKNVYITNSNAITCTDSSGCGVAGFKGTGNVLSLEGINVVEYNIGGGSNPAAIHVKQGDSLTVGGSGTLYFYKSAQGSGFGGSSGELNGDITFSIANMFAKGTKQGALIGAGSGSGSVQTAPGSVTFESGSYNLITNSRGAAVGGAAGSGGASSGTVVNVCKNANVNINVDYTGAAVGGGGYALGNDASGGILYVTGGSLRAYIDTNAASNTSGYNGATYTTGINDAAITAQRLNADDEAVYKCVVDTAGIEANENGDYVVTVDGEEFYVGGLHEYGFVQEGLDKNEQLTITSTPSNWYENDDTCLYLYLTGEDHEVAVNGVAFDAAYDESAVENGTAYTAGAFAVAKASTSVSSPSIVVSNATASAAGETVTVDVSIEGNPGFANYGVELDFNGSELQLVKLEGAGLTPIVTAELSTGKVAFSSDKNVVGDGVLLTATFKVLGGSGDYEVKASVLDMYDERWSELTAAAGTGTIHVHSLSGEWGFDDENHWKTCYCGFSGESASHDLGEWAFDAENGVKVCSCDCGFTRSVLVGDVSGDGKINPLDSTIILQLYVGGQIETGDVEVEACDVNGDGKINPLDSTIILQKYVGTLEKFPVFK